MARDSEENRELLLQDATEIIERELMTLDLRVKPILSALRISQASTCASPSLQLECKCAIQRSNINRSPVFHVTRQTIKFIGHHARIREPRRLSSRHLE